MLKNQQSTEPAGQKRKRDMSDGERVRLLQEKLYCKAKQERGYNYNRKSQRRSGLYGSQAYEVLVRKYGLIEPTKFSVNRPL